MDTPVRSGVFRNGYLATASFSVDPQTKSKILNENNLRHMRVISG